MLLTSSISQSEYKAETPSRHWGADKPETSPLDLWQEKKGLSNTQSRKHPIFLFISFFSSHSLTSSLAPCPLSPPISTLTKYEREPYYSLIGVPVVPEGEQASIALFFLNPLTCSFRSLQQSRVREPQLRGQRAFGNTRKLGKHQETVDKVELWKLMS